MTFRARLSPPLEPLRPGGYDFARDLYFQGIGATGFVLGAIKPGEAPSPPGLWLRYAAGVQGLRDNLDARIRAVLPGDRGSIASALITGKRDAITAPVNDAMYVSSLAHVLSISALGKASAATRRAALRGSLTASSSRQVLTPDAFEEDCRLAAVVVTSREVPGRVQGNRNRPQGFTRQWRHRAPAKWRWRRDHAARAAGQDRPCARSSAVPQETAASTVRSQPRAATPRADDLEAGD